MSAPVIVFVVCAAACVTAHIAILLSTVRSRAQPDSQVPPPRAALEAFWALVPIVALAFLLTATWARVRDRHAEPPSAPIMKVAQ